MGKPLTEADISKVEEEVSLRWAKEAIAKGEGTSMDYWMVAYIESDEKTRRELSAELKASVYPFI